MFGWFKTRIRREHLKLTKQNVLAAQYLLEFRRRAIHLGQMPADRFESVEEMNYKTSVGHLSSLKESEQLLPEYASDALSMNRDLRSQYDQILAGRTAFAQQFGSAHERLLPFDQMFVPNEGWEIFYKHFDSSSEGR